jgi:hypothetical protein
MSNVKRVISLGLIGFVAGAFIAFSVQAGEGQEQGHGKHKGQGNGCGHGKGKGMKGEMPTFADFDLNGDGKIVETEFNQGHDKRMSEMAAEGRQMKHAEDAPGFSGIDSDGNAGISVEEFTAHQDEHHQKMQKCRDTTEQ